FLQTHLCGEPAQVLEIKPDILLGTLGQRKDRHAVRGDHGNAAFGSGVYADVSALCHFFPFSAERPFGTLPTRLGATTTGSVFDAKYSGLRILSPSRTRDSTAFAGSLTHPDLNK